MLLRLLQRCVLEAHYYLWVTWNWLHSQRENYLYNREIAREKKARAIQVRKILVKKVYLTCEDAVRHKEIKRREVEPFYEFLRDAGLQELGGKPPQIGQTVLVWWRTLRDRRKLKSALRRSLNIQRPTDLAARLQRKYVKSKKKSKPMRKTGSTRLPAM